MRRRVVATIGLLSAAACALSSLEPLAHTVTISASKVTAVVNDTINFTVDAQGNRLLGLEIVYDDGLADSLGTAGSRTAHVVFKHAWKARGIYFIEAVATEATEGAKRTGVQIRVD